MFSFTILFFKTRKDCTECENESFPQFSRAFYQNICKMFFSEFFSSFRDIWRKPVQNGIFFFNKFTILAIYRCQLIFNIYFANEN